MAESIDKMVERLYELWLMGCGEEYAVIFEKDESGIPLVARCYPVCMTRYGRIKVKGKPIVRDLSELKNTRVSMCMNDMTILAYAIALENKLKAQ